MKKLCLALCLALSVIFSSCAAPAVSSSADSSSSVADRIHVVKGSSSVTLTLPASFFEDVSKLDTKSYTKQNGYLKTTVNKDGSVSIKMSSDKYRELLETTKNSIDQTLAAMIKADKTPYIQAITSGDDFKTITVDVDRDGYNKAGGDTTPYTIGALANMYQQYSGAEILCEVVIRDAQSRETLFSIFVPVSG